jgi:triphosphatase
MKDEVELKLSIDSKDAPRLLSHLAIANACNNKSTTHKLISVYYDTPDLKLLGAGICLRVQHMSGCWIQSVMSARGSMTGLHQYTEWEDVIAANHPDYTKILDPDLIKLFADQKLRNSLRPIFQTKIRRREWQLAFDNGDKIEFALDRGQLVVDNKSESISEIELKLKAGHTGRLFDFALELQKVIPLELENRSKTQRGYAYLRTDPPVIYKAQMPRLAGNADAASAFKKIAQECINHLQRNQDMISRGDDVEGVHQMRIALRRLRSAFTLFRKVLGRENSAAFLVEISWLADALGKARDLDVLITQTLPVITAQFKQHKGLQMLRDKSITAQGEAYSEVRAALSSQRYNCLLLTLEAWLKNERWGGNTKNAKNYQVIDIASANLSRRYKQLLQYGAGLDHMTPEERHAARITAKKLRYAAEFFASLYSPKKSHAFIKNLSQLQERLGVLNDIRTTETLLLKLAGKKPSHALDEALHILSGWDACNAMHHLTHMAQDWQIFITKKPFWH